MTMGRRRTGRWIAAGLLIVAALPALVFTGLRVAADRLGPPPVAAADATSPVVLDRGGTLLRAFTTPDGRWRLPVALADVDPRYVAMLLAFEDRRFRTHGGVDLTALARAALQLAANGRIVSGGSTLTMQVARLLEGTHERSFTGKLVQIVRARQLEATLSKDEILGLYLRLAPFGGNVEGVRAASLAYFGKEPRRLSNGEAALLVALPQSPETRRPDRSPEAARRARDRVLARAADAGLLTADDVAQAGAEPVPTQRREFPRLAPHLAEAEVRRDPARAIHRLTLDARSQKALEALAREHVRALGSRLSVALLAVEHRTGEIIAHVGSAGYLDDTRFGAVDMVRAVRSPGSTLKPFVYGLGFEAGLAHPEMLIEDRATRFGTFVPKNFDAEFHGTVTIREALAQSLNIPAVKVLQVVGPGRLHARMKRAGASPVLPEGAEPSLAMALGGVGLTLHDLAGLYAGLARGGDAARLLHRQEIGLRLGARTVSAPRLRRVLSPVAAWYVTDILKDAPPPASAKGGRIAYKTGTSYGYRDAWAVGYDGRHTIAVWVGRPDAAATPGLSGRTAAAPILFDAFQRLSEQRAPLPPAPRGAVRTSGADLPAPLKRFREPGSEPTVGPFLEPPVLIAYPLDRSEIEVEAAGDPVLLKADGGALPLTWLIDGAPLPANPMKREVEWVPLARGFARLTVIDARGRVDHASVRVR